MNLAASEETFARAISIPLQGDDFDSIRTEYTEMLQNQLARGNNGLIKTNYLTFGIDADSIKAAKPRLERIETDILNNFKRLGVAAENAGRKGAACPASRYLPHGRTGSVPFRLELAGGQRPVRQGFYRTVRFRVPAPASSSVWVRNTGLFLFCRF